MALNDGVGAWPVVNGQNSKRADAKPGDGISTLAMLTQTVGNHNYILK